MNKKPMTYLQAVRFIKTHPKVIPWFALSPTDKIMFAVHLRHNNYIKEKNYKWLISHIEL